jgi:hypothetical protein
MPFTPPPPTGRLLGFDFHWRECPCFGETVSGDGLFLEVSRTDGQLLLLMVDVMGHGAPAEQIVTYLRDKLLTQPGCWGLSPGQLLALLNTWLAPVSEAGTPQFGGALLGAFLLADPLGPGLVDRLFAALHQHVGPRWPADDTTAFWLERPGGASQPAP